MAPLNPTTLTADCQPSSCGNEDSSVGKQLDDIRRTSKEIKGSITRYILHTMTIFNEENLRRERFGEEDKSKPHKTILMVGETGTGKSTLINAFINHMLGVQWEIRVWCEIIETGENQSETQTTAVIMYDVFIEDFPFSLTVIDTPGYGNTGGIEKDFNIAEILHELFRRSKDGVDEVDAVCFVVTANTTGLTKRQLYVFDAILSLFGKDMEKNIVLLITCSSTNHKNALQAIKASKIKCTTNDAGEIVHFCFDNSHCEDFTVKATEEHKAPWSKNESNMKNFFDFLSDSKPVSVKMTEIVLRTRKQLTAAINNLKDRITLTELKKQELEQTKAALEKCEKEKKDMNDFKYEVDETYKEKVPIESVWWHLTKEVICCSVCEENCHYPDCWSVRDLSQCSVMKKGKCTVCTGRCDYTKHVKESKMYVTKIRRVTKIKEDLKKKYEYFLNLKRRLENEIKEQESEKVRLVEECYLCVEKLEEIALDKDSVATLQYLDFLIEKVKETGNSERVQRLEELKKRTEGANQGLLGFFKRMCFWRQNEALRKNE